MKLKQLLSDISSIAQEIKCSTPYMCGGLVRDSYMKRLDNIDDIDITTGDKSIQYLSDTLYSKYKKQFNITKKVMEDGHSTIYFGNIKVDFSSNFLTPNIENILKNKNIQVTPLNCEIYSRDFTCNSLLATLDGKKILDITNQGIQDINNKIIKCCLDPSITLINSKNRVSRAIYLACKLGFEVDKDIIDFVKNNPTSINIGNKKSISEKLNLAFTYDANKANNLMTEMNLWGLVPVNKNILKNFKGLK